MITAEKPGHKLKSNSHVDVRNSAAPAVAISETPALMLMTQLKKT